MRLKAYTLVEVLVVMALSVLVVGIAYLLLDNVSMMQAELQLRATRSSELVTLDQHLRADARHAHLVIGSASQLIFLSEEVDTIARYTMHAEGLSRTSNGLQQHFFLPVHRLAVRSSEDAIMISIYHGPEPALADSLVFRMEKPITASRPTNASMASENRQQ